MGRQVFTYIFISTLNRKTNRRLDDCVVILKAYGKYLILLVLMQSQSIGVDSDKGMALSLASLWSNIVNAGLSVCPVAYLNSQKVLKIHCFMNLSNNQ